MGSGRRQRAIVGALIVASQAMFAPPTQALCLLGTGDCSQISGIYINTHNPTATLTVTANTISAHQGPITITANYAVKSNDGNQMLLEITAPDSPPGTALLIPEGNILHIRNSFVFAGDWQKK